MKGLKITAKNSKAGDELWYNIQTKEVSLNAKGKGYFVTKLLRKCSESEIEQAVNRWLMM